MSEQTTSTTTTSKARLPLPSLNQLAARMSQSGDLPTTNATTTNRPRLAAFGALRTNSASSNASSVDSLAVQPSVTRDVTPDPSEPSSSDVAADDEDDVEDVAKPVAPAPVPAAEQAKPPVATTNTLNVPTVTKKAPPAGYKNIPSLSDIAARLHRLSVDGTHKPPEPELIEDPKTPGFMIKPAEHPLLYSWTIYHDTKAKLPFTPGGGNGAAAIPGGLTSPVAETPIEAASSSEYEANLTTIGSFKTVEEFCRYFNWLKPPSKLERNSNYHLFKSGIKPMWEDPANANGGKWVLTFKSNPQLLDQCWSWLAMALVGQEIEGTEAGEKGGAGIICGVVVSLRSKVDRIQVWIRKKDDVEQVNAIGKKIVSLLDISEGDGVGLEFQYNTDDRPLPNKFLSIQSLQPNSSYRSSFHARTGSTEAGSPVGPAVAGPGGAFGAFGVGIGGQWRLKK